jgi:signal transduction histidine kinase
MEDVTWTAPRYRRLMPRRSWAFDIAIVAITFALGQAEAWLGIGATHLQGPSWAEALAFGIAALLLIGRRQRPLEVAVAIGLVYVVEFAIFGAPEGNSVALIPTIAVYSVARWEQRHRPVWGLVVALAFGVSWILLDPEQTTWLARAQAAFWLSPSVIAWLAGSLIRSRQQTREQRRLRDEDARTRAVAEERNRIARELHDVIGHNVSVMTVQASAVRRRLGPDQSVEREALETVERSGREALAEMRRMVAVLRAEDHAPDLEPPPGLADVGRLVERFRGAGLPVTLTVTGAPSQLAPGLDLTAYRLVQEGLTNVLRHAAAPERADVVIAYGTRSSSPSATTAASSRRTSRPVTACSGCENASPSTADASSLALARAAASSCSPPCPW